MCAILDTYFSLTRSKVIETLESYQADPEIAGVLETTPGFPLILLQDLLLTTTGEPYEYTKVYFRGDKITLKIEYEE